MIKLLNISKSYDNKEILTDVNLEVEKNSSVAIMGESGSGKTTILRVISGLIRPDQGKVYIDQKLVEDKKNYIEPYKRNVGFIFQEATLWSHMNVKRNIEFGLSKLGKVEREARCLKVMEQTGIKDLSRRYPHQLSGGQAKRVAIARALAPNPNYLLLDEPLTNLDQKAKNQLLDLLLAIREETKCTYIYVSHQKDEIRHLSKVIYILSNGRLVNYE